MKKNKTVYARFLLIMTRQPLINTLYTTHKQVSSDTKKMIFNSK